MNFTPSTIFNHLGEKIPTSASGYVIATVDVDGWTIFEEIPPSDTDKSDFWMLPRHYIAQGVDVLSACGILNDLTNE